jgi:hypothetical protein
MSTQEASFLVRRVTLTSVRRTVAHLRTTGAVTSYAVSVTGQAPPDYNGAWRYLRRLQRATLMVGLGGIGGIVWLAHLATLANGFALAPMLLLLALFGWMSAMVILIAQRLRFCCPRCGKRFRPNLAAQTAARPLAERIAQRCSNCGIRAGEIPDASSG